MVFKTLRVHHHTTQSVLWRIPTQSVGTSEGSFLVSSRSTLRVE